MTSALIFGSQVLAVDPPPTIRRAASGDILSLSVDGAKVGWSDGRGYAIIPTTLDAQPDGKQWTGEFTGEIVDGLAQITRTWQVMPDPVPSIVPKLWLIRALRHLNIKSTFDAWLASQSAEVQEDWDACTEIKRADPITEAAKLPPLSMTDEQLDNIWRLANTLGEA